jgi:hypothetical protein
MKSIRQWTVDVLVGENDGQTYAEVRLQGDIGNDLVGTGRAQLNPTDADIPVIGDEIAVGRALTDLGQRLLRTAAGDIQEITHEPVRLHS